MSDQSQQTTEQPFREKRRSPQTSAETWKDEHIDDETALELLEKLRGQGHECRLVVQAKHPDSCVVKTVETQENADQTLANIFYEEEFGDE